MPRLVYRFSERADLYSFLRGAASAPSADDDAWNVLIDRACATFAMAASVSAALLVDPAICGFDGSLAELVDEAQLLPTEIDGVPVRAFAADVAALLGDAEDVYRRTILDERRASVDAGIDFLRQHLGPVEGECVSFICDAFGLGEFDASIPVTVVASGVPLGGMTSLDFGDYPQCLVAVSGQDGSLLAEVVLHEATHALGLLSPARASSTIATLRAATARWTEDRDLGQLWHVPYFVTAAEAVRRYIDPHHEAYGVRSRYYAKCPRAAAIVVEPWQARLDGQLTPDGAVQEILNRLDSLTG